MGAMNKGRKRVIVNYSKDTSILKEASLIGGEANFLFFSEPLAETNDNTYPLGRQD